MTAYPRPYSLNLTLTPADGAAILESFHRAEGGYRHWHRLQPDPDSRYLVAYGLVGAEGRSDARFEFAPAPTGCTLTIKPAEAADWGARLNDPVRGLVGSFRLASEPDPTCVDFCARFEAHLRALGVVTEAPAPVGEPDGTPARSRSRSRALVVSDIERAYKQLADCLEHSPTQEEVARELAVSSDTVRRTLGDARSCWSDLKLRMDHA